MTDEAAPPKQPGPWDLAQTATPANQPRENKGQPLIWAILSTALLAGWLGWRMGWVWALAGVVGVLVHE